MKITIDENLALVVHLFGGEAQATLRWDGGSVYFGSRVPVMVNRVEMSFSGTVSLIDATHEKAPYCHDLRATVLQDGQRDWNREPSNSARMKLRDSIVDAYRTIRKQDNLWQALLQQALRGSLGEMERAYGERDKVMEKVNQKIAALNDLRAAIPQTKALYLAKLDLGVLKKVSQRREKINNTLSA